MKQAPQVYCKVFIALAILFPAFSFALPNDTIYQIALLLPFQCESTIGKLDEITSATDLFTANRVRFNEDAVLSLDFYQGVAQALSDNTDSIKTEIHAYDTWDDDSVTTELLKRAELKKMDFIIGGVSSSTSKLVADFCKANKIMNLQPFTPSKSLTSGNPYHLKLAPTIDAHVDYMFQSILDSFPDANIIIYTPKNERSMPVANRFDSLFRAYNLTADKKYKVSFLNATDQTVDGVKTSPSELINRDKPNILIITSYDEPFIEGALRTVNEKAGKTQIVVYGLPTWLNGDILRLDYLNNFHTRISDPFWADTLREKQRTFINSFETNYSVEPSRYAYLGYDVLNFMLRCIKIYGKDFVGQIITQRYSGLGYKFDISRNMKSADEVNYYENTHVNVLKIEDYRLLRVW